MAGFLEKVGASPSICLKENHGRDSCNAISSFLDLFFRIYSMNSGEYYCKHTKVFLSYKQIESSFFKKSDFPASPHLVPEIPKKFITSNRIFIVFRASLSKPLAPH